MNTQFRPHLEMTSIMTQTPPPLKRTWHDCLGRRLPCLFPLAPCRTSWPCVLTSSSRRILSFVIIAPMSTLVKRAGLPLIPALRPSQSFLPMVGHYSTFLKFPFARLTGSQGRHLTLEDIQKFIVLDDNIHLCVPFFLLFSCASLNRMQCPYRTNRTRKHSRWIDISTG